MIGKLDFLVLIEYASKKFPYLTEVFLSLPNKGRYTSPRVSCPGVFFDGALCLIN
tara:strand:+ start:175 stop:339 length:165 start_codon:yes stop_codon:yes gene_type:complete